MGLVRCSPAASAQIGLVQPAACVICGLVRFSLDAGIIICGTCLVLLPALFVRLARSSPDACACVKPCPVQHSCRCLLVKLTQCSPAAVVFANLSGSVQLPASLVGLVRFSPAVGVFLLELDRFQHCCRRSCRPCPFQLGCRCRWWVFPGLPSSDASGGSRSFFFCPPARFWWVLLFFLTSYRRLSGICQVKLCCHTFMGLLLFCHDLLRVGLSSSIRRQS